jgi:nitroreductase
MEHPKIARSGHEILDVIARRWSPRAFDPTREVAMADLLRLFEAARWAPSSRNEQPWRFVIADRGRQPETFAAVRASLRGANQQWAHAAPVLVLVACRLTHERDEAVNLHAWYDTGQAVGFLTLQATSMGLSVRQMEGFDRAIVRDVLDVPAAFEPAVMMAIGYSGDPDTLVSEKHRAAERTLRTRRPLEETVFVGRWGNTIS